jgi:hypothetical protein
MIYIPEIDAHHYESKQGKLDTIGRNHIEVHTFPRKPVTIGIAGSSIQSPCSLFATAG